MSNPESRLHVALVGGAGALLALAGFAVPFWALLGQGVQSTFRTGLAAALGTSWVLAVLYGVWRASRAWSTRQAERAAAARAGSDAALAAARDAQAAAGHAALLADPRWQRFHPLIRRWRLWDERWLLDAEHRYIALLADPRRAHHAPGVLEGEHWGEAQLEYFDDPLARATCLHLQPVEAALRAAGRRCWPQRTREIATEAGLQWESLQRGFALPDSVGWQIDEPHPHVGPREIVHCRACDSAIESGHGAPFPPDHAG